MVGPRRYSLRSPQARRLATTASAWPSAWLGCASGAATTSRRPGPDCSRPRRKRAFGGDALLLAEAYEQLAGIALNTAQPADALAYAERAAAAQGVR